MNVYDVSAVLMLDSSEFSRNLDTAIRSLEKFGETAGRIFDEISKAAEFMTANVGAQIYTLQEKLDSLRMPETELQNDETEETESIWSKLKATLSDFELPDLQALGEADDAAGSLYGTLSSLSGAAPALSGLFGGLGGDLVVVAGAAAALAGAATTIKGLHDSLSGDDNGDSADLDGVVKSLEDANSQLDAFSVAMSSTVPGAVSSLAASFTPVVEMFGSGLPEAVSASAESASGFLTAVTELGAALSTVFGAASEEIGDTAEAFTVMTGEIVGSLEELSAEIPSVFEAVSEGGTAAAGELDASFTSVIDTIEAKWSALLSFVTSAYSSISTMASAAQTMADTVSGVKAGLSKLTTANAPSLPASSSFGLDNNSWLGHAAELAGRGLERIGEFAVGTVERAQSALGKIEQNVVNTILLNSNDQPYSAPTQITVNLDGREMASAIYEPLIEEGKRSGRSLYSK